MASFGLQAYALRPVAVRVTAQHGRGMERERPAQKGPSYYEDNYSPAGRWVEKRNDNPRGRNDYPRLGKARR
jgi:hypothetical protein